MRLLPYILLAALLGWYIGGLIEDHQRLVCQENAARWHAAFPNVEFACTGR